MKLKVLFRPNVSPLLSVKAALINKRLGTAKIYELLHKQIWRKARKTRVITRQLPMFKYYNGRPVEFISSWDIKSFSVEPYSRDAPFYDDVAKAGDPLFGLNQFFMMSKNDPEANRKSEMMYHYAKPYPGNPKAKNGGIYADYCYIEPKAYKLVSDRINQWSYESFKYQGDPVTFKETSPTGVRLLESASVEFKEYPDSKGNLVQWVVVKCVPVSGAPIYYKMEEANGLPLSMFQSAFSYVSSGSSYVLNQKEYENQLAVDHGGLKYRLSLTGAEYPLNDWVYTYNADTRFYNTAEKGYILMFGDGTVIEYVPYHYEENASGLTDEAHYKVLPMVYTDTGDLAMPRKDFVDNWADMFTLVVVEKSTFLEVLAAPFMAIISVVIAFYTAGSLGWSLWGILTMAGGVVTAVGVLGHDKKAMAIGGILSAIGLIGSTISSIGTQSAASVAKAESAGTLARTGSTAAVQGATESSGIGAVFNKLTSSSGLWNLVRIGKSSFDLFQSVRSLGTSDESAVAAINEDTKRIEAEFGPAALEEYTEEYNVPMIVVKPHIEVLQTMQDI